MHARSLAAISCLFDSKIDIFRQQLTEWVFVAGQIRFDSCLCSGSDYGCEVRPLWTLLSSSTLWTFNL